MHAALIQFKLKWPSAERCKPHMRNQYAMQVTPWQNGAAECRARALNTRGVWTMAAITISSTALNGWQGNSTGVQLRIYTNSAFTASSGNVYPITQLTNPASLGQFYQAFNCTVSGTTMTIPSISLDSTSDSPDNPNATYSAVLFDSQSGQAIQSFGTTTQFTLLPTPTTTTWGAIFAAGADY